uniref:PDS5 cohesin associated factor B n=1 Tax=Hucho hucho TaxID=62062 RepID=A0A4W5JKV5_9TELE
MNHPDLAKDLTGRCLMIRPDLVKDLTGRCLMNSPDLVKDLTGRCLMIHPDLVKDLTGRCLMIRPDLVKDLTGTFWSPSLGDAALTNIYVCIVQSEFLKVRSHDPEEAIRHDVIVTIINAGKKDLNLVNDQLLGFVRERTLDKRWRVRKEAMMGLAQLFKKYCLHHEAGKEQAQKISWIKDKLLHIYYQNSIDDKLLVEKIFAQYMVPHSLDTEEKMKCLYYLYACLDTNAVKLVHTPHTTHRTPHTHTSSTASLLTGGV